MTETPEVLRGLSWNGVVWAFTTGHAWNWHPLTWLSHMVDVQLFGLDAGLHHLTNVLLHIANTVLVFAVFRRMTGAVGRSAFVAAIFGVHPLNVESVAWVAERKNVLGTLFWMLALWAYVAYARGPDRRRYLAVLVLFACGLMVKPTLVTLPFVLLLLDVWPLRRVAVGRRLVWEKLPLLLLAVAVSLITLMVQQRGGNAPDLGALPLGLRLANALNSYRAYVAAALWPAGLAAFYPYPASFPAWKLITAALLLLGGSLLAWTARRRGYPAVGWLWYLGTLVPVIGLVQVGNQALADRHAYVPLIGLFVMAAWGVPDILARWPPRRLVLPAAAALVIGALAITARAQVMHWMDNTTLWEHALAVTEGNHVAHNSLGNVLMRQGRAGEAIIHYTEAVRLRPRHALARNNLGVALVAEGRLDEAVAAYAEALRIDPDYATAHQNLGLALARLGRIEEAAAQYDEVLHLDPGNEQARQARAALAPSLERKGRDSNPR